MRFEHQDLTSGIPSGDYLARIDSITERESTSGNPMVVVELALQDSTIRDGLRVRDYFVIAGSSPPAAAIGRRRLASLCALSGLKVKPGSDVDLEQLIGRIVTVSLSEDAIDGQPIARVKGYRAASDCPAF